MQITDQMKDQLSRLGLINYKQDIKVVATAQQGELKKSCDIRMKQHTDCTYFIFRDQILMKIGKVGGGTRCISKRISDYRSTDPTGLKIKQAIQEGADVKILAICFEKGVESLYGVLTEGGVKGPKLEKALLENAAELQINLEWNSNRG